MASVIRTGFRAIAPLLVTRIAEVVGIPEERIAWVARNNVPHFQGESEILLRLRRGFSVQETAEGGGRWDTRIQRVLDVAIRISDALDESASDEQWLFGESGYIAYEEAVIDALQTFLPTDKSGNALLAEPMRLLQSVADPAKETGNEVIWGDGTLAFELIYTLDLDTTGE